MTTLQVWSMYRLSHNVISQQCKSLTSLVLTDVGVLLVLLQAVSTRQILDSICESGNVFIYMPTCRARPKAPGSKQAAIIHTEGIIHNGSIWSKWQNLIQEATAQPAYNLNMSTSSLEKSLESGMVGIQMKLGLC